MSWAVSCPTQPKQPLNRFPIHAVLFPPFIPTYPPTPTPFCPPEDICAFNLDLDFVHITALALIRSVEAARQRFGWLEDTARLMSLPCFYKFGIGRPFWFTHLWQTTLVFIYTCIFVILQILGWLLFTCTV
jgi:hypothetical protein